jgi:chromosomal replication initiator protein
MQLVLDFPVTPRFSFDNFVVCSGNETAFRFAQRLVESHAEESILYLYGPSGSGKTHLLEACAAAIAQNADSGLQPPLFSFRETPGIAPQTIASLLQRRFHDAPALLIDDIHLAPADQFLKGQIWQLFNDFHAVGRPIVITGLNPPKELANLDEHLVSRLLWGLVARVDVSDDDSRRMIMRKLSVDRQIVIPEDTVDYLLRHLPRDIPSLITTLDRIVRHSLATGRKVSIRLVSELMTSSGNTI